MKRRLKAWKKVSGLLFYMDYLNRNTYITIKWQTLPPITNR